ncbi:MAG: ATP-binding protein [Parafannyhessea sp.]|uniref:ATP-binding protein n=1 Tax=Parafannyhessea sp. TaxID=2847324 RepID=UPI003F004C66
MYIEREIEQMLRSYLKQFKCVLVTGARQTGKTTLLKHVLGDTYDYVTLDDVNELNNAIEDPGTFLTESSLPVIIDEVQLAPNLFRQVKFIVDAGDEYGGVVLTGSQTYNLMQGVSESLAGRVGILRLDGLSLREIAGNLKSEPYIPRQLARREVRAAPEDFDLWGHIQRGSMPRLQDADIDWYAFYSSYASTYLERDVRQLVNVRDQRKFFNFMVAAAARTGQLLNVSDIADAVDADAKTVRGWLSVLEASGIVVILQPFWANANKRLTKTPKLYFMDTGLACYLTGWNTAEQLRRGAMSGRMFETFVVSEVLKSYANAGRDTRDVFFYRDARKREIDLVIKDGNTLHPIEIKAGANVRRDAIKNFSALDELSGYEVGFGNVICQTETPYMLGEKVQAVPVWAI